MKMFTRSDLKDCAQSWRCLVLRCAFLRIWLAKVGYERIEETEDPELVFDRAMQTYLKKGYTREWVSQRFKSIEVRKELADEWQSCRTKKDRSLELKSIYQECAPGRRKMVVKVVDIFGNDTMKIVEVTI